MKKRLFLILVALVVACGTMAAAFADDTNGPSKTTADLVVVTPTVSEEVPPEVVENFKVTTFDATATEMSEEIQEKYAEACETTQAEIKKLAEIVADETATVADYFGDITSITEEGADEAVALADFFEEDATLVVEEFMPMLVDGYDEAIGDVDMVQTFATEYELEETVVVMIGVPVVDETTNESKIVWTAIKAEVVALETAEGTTAQTALKYTVPQKLMKAMNGKNALLAVVRAEAAAEVVETVAIQ